MEIKAVSSKKYIFLLLLLCGVLAQSQTYVKVNAITILLTIPQVGIETGIGEKSTFQFDITASFWKSVDGKPKEFYIFIPEYRYHFKEKHQGFYAGAHVGLTLYNFQKWNYLNSNLYEKGFGYLMGATIGFQQKINDQFLLDVFIGGGNSQGYYKGYYIGTDTRYESAEGYNKSGEWLPYRMGVMVSYKLK